MSASAEQLRRIQRADLSAQLQAQRRIIRDQFGAGAGEPDGFPRSKTMRLLTVRPDVVINVLGTLASLFRRR